MVSDFRKNQKEGQRKRFIIIIGGILLSSVLLVLVVADINIYKKRMEYVSQLENLKNKIDTLKEENNVLNQKIENIDDPSYIEKIAREELGLQKEGEQAVSFIVSQDQVLDDQKPKQNFFKAWFLGAWQWVADLVK